MSRSLIRENYLRETPIRMTNCIGSLKLCHAWEFVCRKPHYNITTCVHRARGYPSALMARGLILHILDTRVSSCEDSLSPVRKCHFRSRDNCYKPVSSLYGIQLGYTHHTLTCICTCVLTHACMHAYIHIPGISVCAHIQMDNNGQMDKGTQELGQALTNS